MPWPRRVVARARVEHAEEVRERGDAADRRAGGRRAALLLEGDRRREAVDLVDLRDGHLVEQPPRVRRHGLEVAPLRLGVEGAEGERRLARAGDAGEDDEGVARDLDVDVLEVVDSGAADVDEAVVGGHPAKLSRSGRPDVSADTEPTPGPLHGHLE